MYLLTILMTKKNAFLSYFPAVASTPTSDSVKVHDTMMVIQS